VVEASGSALRMEAARFHKTFLQCLSLQEELYRYAYATAGAGETDDRLQSFHLSDQRIARWLLMTSDRVRSEEFFLTQTFMADMLGCDASLSRDRRQPTAS